jgi:uncharacterized protein
MAPQFTRPLTPVPSPARGEGGWARPLPRNRVRGGYHATLLFTVLAAVLLAASGVYAEPKFPPLTGQVVDDAHLLSPSDKASIEADLKDLQQKSSDQLVVYTADSLQGYPIEDFGYQLGRAWGIGQKGTNNGAILIVVPKERRVRIEVGRGLEPQLTDLMTSLIIRNRILPEFRRGQYAAGIKAGVKDIKDVMLGDAEAVKQRAAARPPVARKGSGWGALIPIAFIAGIFIFIFWAQSWQSRQSRRPLSGGRYRRSDDYYGPVFFPGGWGGGGGGGGGSGGDGGGFSGGGGDFGGGGASGDW